MTSRCPLTAPHPSVPAQSKKTNETFTERKRKQRPERVRRIYIYICVYLSLNVMVAWGAQREKEREGEREESRHIQHMAIAGASRDYCLQTRVPPVVIVIAVVV